MDKTKSKPRGRPRLARSARKRNFVTMRMRDALKAQLEEAAEANQRSLSEEIEYQLEELVLLRRLQAANIRMQALDRQMIELGLEIGGDTALKADERNELIGLIRDRYLSMKNEPLAAIEKNFGGKPGEPAGEEDKDKNQDLSPRERQVLERLRQGKHEKIIAHELDMSESTVKVYLRHIMKKLNARNRTQVVLKIRDADFLGAKQRVGEK
jgi:DNA-binding CsgD family transcriptional regulator